MKNDTPHYDLDCGLSMTVQGLMDRVPGNRIFVFIANLKSEQISV